jgi:hypothetical protein
MTATLGYAAPLGGFNSPRRKARKAFIWSALLTGFGALSVAATVALLAAAWLIFASFSDSRTIDDPEALNVNTTVIAKSSGTQSTEEAARRSDREPIRTADASVPASIFNASPLPLFSSAILAPDSSIRGSADRLSPSLNALASDTQPEILSSAPRNDAVQVAIAPDSTIRLPLLPPHRRRSQDPADASNRPMVLASAQPEIPEIRDDSSALKTETPAALPALANRTAIYDIAAHTVYMPNGERLEAHSGLGDRLDDVRYVSERNRGPTPPHVYDLKLRESLFHGVQAVRLNPVGGTNPFGRTGLLAHTYMLGPRGDSNGCISFKDYQKFLQAFKRGEVTRLAVVTHWKDAPPAVASTGLSGFLRYAFGGS